MVGKNAGAEVVAMARISNVSGWEGNMSYDAFGGVLLLSKDEE
jgi:hypothetical protein